jgi:CheY-like chemotaxis protein
MGLQVVHAENGEKAASLFEMSYVGEYAAILMDIQMPVMNGYEAAEKIRHMDRDDAGTIPMIAMTADAFTEALEHSRQAGMNDYIVKPIDIVRLRNTLNKWIRKQAI